MLEGADGQGEKAAAALAANPSQWADRDLIVNFNARARAAAIGPRP
jgi:hypothetical protein